MIFIQPVLKGNITLLRLPLELVSLADFEIIMTALEQLPPLQRNAILRLCLNACLILARSPQGFQGSYLISPRSIIKF